MNKFPIISAPSGGGKSTLIRMLILKYPNLFELCVSCTTRKPRENEVHGTHYHFIELEDFATSVEQGEFMEYQEVYPGCFYGTKKGELTRIINKSKIPILDIDIFGAIGVKHLFPEASLIFMMPEKQALKVLEKRLRERLGSTEEDNQRRLKKAPKEMQRGKENADYILYNSGNDNIEDVFRRFEEILKESMFLIEEPIV